MDTLKAEILKDAAAKTTRIRIETPSSWQLYAGDSVDAIDLSKPAAKGGAGGIFVVNAPFFPHQYFQLAGSGGGMVLAERHLPMEGGYNFRDLGGYPAERAFVKWGRVFRTDDMMNLTQQDLDYLASIPLRTVVDFRSGDEVAGGPDKVPSSVINHVSLPVVPGNLSETSVSDFDPELHITDIYRSFCTDKGIVAQYRKFFALMQDEANLPLSFHCSAGKDRTGMAAALFLSSLGVSEKIIMRDYLLSNKCLENKYASLIEEQPYLKAMFIVEAGYLRIALDQIKADYGSVEKYLSNTLNVDIDKMRSIYLVNRA
ncbi:MAG: tyrosine-protein phosphatase [Treponema sp.]|jgi:protein-tyrosine phosphatase|nr:tyrosine-protein phosphatase [Treponema sp.]